MRIQVATKTSHPKTKSAHNGSETRLFIKRALSNPRQLGAVIPSSSHLGKMVASQLDLNSSRPILELGGGTGALTQAMLKAGVDPSRIYTVELDPELCAFLKEKFPKCNIILGNAGELEKILPPEVVGQIQATVSGLPLLNMPQDVRDAIVKSALNVMGEDGYILQYTYSPKASIRLEDYGLKREKAGTVLRNVPPAIVWKYSRA